MEEERRAAAASPSGDAKPPLRLEDVLAAVTALAAKLDRDIAGIAAKLDRDIAGIAAKLDRDITGIAARLDRMEEKHDEFEKKVEGRFTKLEERMTKLEERMTNLEERFTKVEERTTKLEERMTKLEERMTKVEERMTKLEERMTKVEERMTKVEERTTKVEERMTNLEERFTKVEESVKQLSKDVREATRLLGHVFENDARALAALSEGKLFAAPAIVTCLAELVNLLPLEALKLLCKAKEFESCQEQTHWSCVLVSYLARVVKPLVDEFIDQFAQLFRIAGLEDAQRMGIGQFFKVIYGLIPAKKASAPRGSQDEKVLEHTKSVFGKHRYLMIKEVCNSIHVYLQKGDDTSKEKHLMWCRYLPIAAITWKILKAEHRQKYFLSAVEMDMKGNVEVIAMDDQAPEVLRVHIKCGEIKASRGRDAWKQLELRMAMIFWMISSITGSQRFEADLVLATGIIFTSKRRYDLSGDAVVEDEESEASEGEEVSRGTPSATVFRRASITNTDYSGAKLQYCVAYHVV